MKIKNYLIVPLMITLLCFCKHIPVKKPVAKAPQVPSKKSHKEIIKKPETGDKIDFTGIKITLVLAGLDARGFANIGILRGLEKHHIFPSKIVATGMGGLTAAFYCADSNSFSLEWKHFKLTKDIYFGHSLFAAKTGRIKPDNLIDFIEESIDVKRIEDLTLQLIIVTADLKTGRTIPVKSGTLSKAIYDGIAIPGLFEPIKYRSLVPVTGYLTEGVPIETALKEDTDVIIAVDLDHSTLKKAPDSIDKINIQAVKVAGKKHFSHYLEHKKVFTIRPGLSTIGPMQFEDKKAIMNIGLHAVDSISGKLKRFLSRIKRRK